MPSGGIAAGQLSRIEDSRRSADYRYDPVGRLIEVGSRLFANVVTCTFEEGIHVVDPAGHSPPFSYAILRRCIGDGEQDETFVLDTYYMEAGEGGKLRGDWCVSTAATEPTPRPPRTKLA